jgi:hypothetical protein
MLHDRKNKPKGIFIVGELPEELTSYRHSVACLLNAMASKTCGEDRSVYAYTGDIGLHIGLGQKSESGKLIPKIRCAYCNFNNELICKHKNYHTPDKISEIMIKRLQSAMIYLCSAKDHYPQETERPRYFLSWPDLRVI